MECQVRVCVSGLSIQVFTLWDRSQSHLLRLTKIISTVKVQSFVSYATGWEWESRIFCYWMKNAAVREFSYFSLVSVKEGACFLVIFFMLTDHFSRPNGSARFPLFFLSFFVVYAATFLGYKYCTK
jgi:hypothetical protein